MKEHIELISSHLRERLSNPLMASFLLSWPVWNYKFILVFFSDMKPYVKFSYISGQVYPDVWHGLMFGLFGPVVTACFYVGVYPFVVHAAEFVSSWHRMRLENQRIKHNNETPLSEERAKELWQEFRKSVKSYEKEIDDSAARIKNLKADLAAYEQRLAEASSAEHNLRVDLASQKLACDTKDKEYGELKRKHGDLREMLELETALRNELMKEKDDLDEKLKAANEEGERLKQVIREQSIEKAGYEKNKSMFMMRAEVAQQDNRSLKNRVEVLEAQAASKDVEIGHYKKIIANLKSGGANG